MCVYSYIFIYNQHLHIGKLKLREVYQVIRGYIESELSRRYLNPGSVIPELVGVSMSFSSAYLPLRCQLFEKPCFTYP